MREIKFRVWDEEYKEYGQPFTKFVTAEDGSEFEFVAFRFSYGIISLSDALKNPNRYITEQYTGLKDKKRTEEFPEGQEIYEGDIVKADWRVGKWEIVFSDGGFVMNIIPDAHAQIFIQNELVEIIGTIYTTHPELLSK